MQKIKIKIKYFLQLRYKRFKKYKNEKMLVNLLKTSITENK